MESSLTFWTKSLAFSFYTGLSKLCTWTWFQIPLSPHIPIRAYSNDSQLTMMGTLSCCINSSKHFYSHWVVSTVEECKPLYFSRLYSQNKFSVTAVCLSGLTIIHACAFESPWPLSRAFRQNRSAIQVVKYLMYEWVIKRGWRLFLALSRQELASQVSFFGSHDNGRSRKTPPEEFQSVVPGLLLCHQLGTVPLHLSSASNQWALHGNMHQVQRDWTLALLVKENCSLFTQAL